MKFEIAQMLVLSTGHLRKETADSLPETHKDVPDTVEQAHWWPSFIRNEGWMFYVPLDPEDQRYIDAPEELKNIAAFAKAIGCTWVMLDQDGPIVDVLPHWEW